VRWPRLDRELERSAGQSPRERKLAKRAQQSISLAE
jgi:hypothetical protein